MPRTRREQLTFPINIRRLTVSRVVDVTPGLRRITLTGAQLGAFTTADGIAVPPLRNHGFDDHVKIIVPELGESTIRPPRQVEGHLDWSNTSTGKDYTPRRWDPACGELDLEFVRHGTGAASRWVERVTEGDDAFIAGPKASALLPQGIDWLLVGGDETAVPAIGRLIDDLPPDTRAQVFIETADAAHEVPLPGLTSRPGIELTWLHRDGAEPGTSDVLERAIRAAQWWPGTPYAWVAGEALTLKPIRAHLKYDRQVPLDCLEVVGYWRRTEVRRDEVSGAEVVEVDDTHQRLDALLELTPGVAIRAAATLGIIARLDVAAVPAETLAGDLALVPGPALALLRYLATIDVLARDGESWTLGTLGAALADDEELLAQLTLDSASDLLELSVPGLVQHVRSGATSGVAGRLVTDPNLVQQHRDLVADFTTWSAPSIVQHWDWTAHDTVTVLGAGAPEVAANLLQTHPRVRVEATIGVPDDVDSSVVLAVHLLDTLTDEAGATTLAGLAATLPDDGLLLLAERTLDTADLHDHDAELDLKLRVGFGSGVRTELEWGMLFAAAGVTVVERRPVGRDTVLWSLRSG